MNSLFTSKEGLQALIEPNLFFLQQKQ